MDEVLYGGGQSVPVRADNQPDASEVVSDMFFIAAGALLSNEFEIVATKPLRLDGSEDDEVYVMITFKGRVNNEKQLGAFTVLMAPEALKALITMGRNTYANIPIEYR